MRSLNLALVLLTLASASAEAAPRKFRLNDGATAQGLGIGWGIKGETVDFEKIEENEEAAQKWIDAKMDKIQNYLVDIRTNSVLAVIGGPGARSQWVDAHFANMHIGNHFTIGIVSIDFHGEVNQDMIVQSNNFKWFNELENIFVVGRTGPNGNKRVVDATCDNCHAQFEALLLAQLTPEMQDKYKRYGARDFAFSGELAYTQGNHLDFALTASIPKEDTVDPIELKGRVMLKVEGKKVKLTSLELTK